MTDDTLKQRRLVRQVRSGGGMHRRHLAELVGQEEPKSGLTVHAYSQPFNFEYQVRRHLEAAMRQWPNENRRKTENRIRRSLAIGSAWLYPEPQLYLELGPATALCGRSPASGCSAATDQKGTK